MRDKRYQDGKILCSMCTKPHPIAQKAYRMFLDSNLGDSGLFEGTAELERQVIAQLAELLHGEGSVGFIVSGGTEANLLALAAAKNTLRKNQPEVVLPESAHFSFTKICSLLGIKPVYAKLDSHFRADLKDVEAHINKNTIGIVGTAGTAELGVVDPIDALSETAVSHGVFLHVDAAFGGLVLPFLPQKTPFDFGLEGVKSVTVDPHKMGLAAIPAGGILFKDAKTRECLRTNTPYLSSPQQYTFSGTRSGAAAASAWAVFKFLGFEGYRKIVAKCMKTTKTIASGVEKVGFKLVCEPTVNIVAFHGENTRQAAEKLWRRGWFVSYVPRYDCIRIVVMPHVKTRHANAFLGELGQLGKL